MTGLSLSLLGPFSAYLNGRPLHKFRTNRVQALLAYLATESALGTRRHRREALMEMFWPGLPLKSAQVNLRQTVYQLRLAISEESGADGDEPIPFVLSDRQSVQINRAYPLEFDVSRFLAFLSNSPDRWPVAFELYRGDFLPDFYLMDANPFEEWAAARRAAFRQQVLDALDRLADEALREGELETAERYGRRQLEIDKLRESAYRQLMITYAWNARQSDSLALYQEWVRIVGSELGASPDEATTALYDTIREGRLGTAPTKSSAPATDTIFPEISEPAIPTSPYRGLYAFREEDSPFFFGREAYTDKLLDAVGKRIIVAVVGPSGSGKSSVLHAGLMANLRAAGGWVAVTFRPGSDPFQALAAALHPWLEAEIHEAERLLEIRRLSAALAEGTLPLDDVFTRIIGKHSDADRLLLAVDQFEELYTLCPEPDIRRRFLDTLLAAVSEQALHREPAFTFVLTLRADFLGQALSYRPFADALQDADVKLGPMTREELARAIEQPAGLQKVSFDEGLADRIVDDVGNAPGNLPLLQFALAALWERQVRSRLTHASYEESGRVQGALALYADQIYGGLGSAEQEAAQRLFVQLVRPGGRAEDTRRLASRTELGESDWALAQRLADARLVVVDRDPSGQETAELVHEALIQRWQRLQRWIETDRAFRTWQERLRVAIRQWETSQYDEGGLLRGYRWLKRRAG
jgi:DNA-binding SARP family transcriptional activator